MVFGVAQCCAVTHKLLFFAVTRHGQSTTLNVLQEGNVDKSAPHKRIVIF